LKSCLIPKDAKYMKKLIFMKPATTIVTIIRISNLSKKPPTLISLRVSKSGKLVIAA
jgi:hypothetical protein